MERIKKYAPLWGTWEIKRKIGEGSFGTVYEVERTSYGVTSRAAVKLITFRNVEMLYGIPVDETLSEDEMKKIKEEEAMKNVREVSLMNTLQGSNHIVTIHDFKIIPGESTTDVLILMELLTNLSHYVRNGGADREFVIKMGIDICKALESCEKEKIIHRDIKPDNIFVNKEGDFKLGDFGLSRKMSQSVSVSLRKTKGTPLYMPPEAYQWEQKVDHTSDLYSLGIVMYQLLNERNIPFGTKKGDYDDEAHAIGRRFNGEEILPPVHEKGRLWKIIQKAICFKKEERYQSAGLMRKDLEELVQRQQEGTTEQVDAESQYLSGNRYYYGEGVEQDYKKAVYWYEKAAEQGYDEAQTALGECYYNGEGVEQDYKKAVYWYEKAAEQGFAGAQTNLGNCYYNGKGVEQDYRKAVYWYKKAAEQGYAMAQNNLGDCYYRKGVDNQYIKRGKEYYKKAVYWYEKAAKQGYARAQTNLGDCYHTGRGVERDYKKAVEWYEKAAEQGYDVAQKNLGNCYYYGEGVEKDYKKAVYWYEKAAEQGYTIAQNNLGNCYSFGRGVEKDYKKAVYWYEKTAEQGGVATQYKLGNRYYNGEGVEKDYKKAVYWYEKAAEQGYDEAQTALGECYYNGEGVEQDYKKAVHWYEKAAEQGYDEAQAALGECYYYGKGVEKDYNKALYWYDKAGVEDMVNRIKIKNYISTIRQRIGI